MSPSPPGDGPPASRRCDALSLGLVALQIATFWIVPHVPTQDGPVHLEIAALLRRLLAGSSTIAPELFAINATPEPNWLVHGVLALLLGIVSPAVADRLLLTAYAVIAAAATRYALRGVGSGSASGDGHDPAHLLPLALPLLFGFPLQMGFYNFCFGLAIWLAAVGLWLRHGRSLRLGSGTVLAALLLVAYACHPVALFSAYVTLGVLLVWRVTLAARDGASQQVDTVHREALPLVVAAGPSAILAAAYVGEEVARTPEWLPLRALLKHLLSGWSLVAFDRIEVVLAVVWVALVAVAAVLVLRSRPRRRDPTTGLLLVTATFLGLYFAAPVGVAGGGYLNQRLEVVAFLLAVLVLAAGLDRSAFRFVRVAGAALALGFILVHAAAYRRLSPLVAEIVTAGEAVPPGSVLLPLSFDHRGGGGVRPSLKVMPTENAASLIGAGRDVGQLKLFQASMGYFPIVYRHERDPHRVFGESCLEDEVHDLELASWDAGSGLPLDAVLFWELGDAPPAVRSRWATRLTGWTLAWRAPSGRTEVWLRPGLADPLQLAGAVRAGGLETSQAASTLATLP